MRKTKFHKKTYRKAYKKAAKRTNPREGVKFLGGGSPIPPRMITCLKYAQHFNWSSNATPIVHQFSLNSIFTPAVSPLSGHQPYGRDTYANLYSRYRVFATHWFIRAASLGGVLETVVAPSNDNNFLALLLDAPAWAEKSRAVMKVTETGSNASVFKGKINLARLKGQTPTEYKGDDGNKALMSQDPADPLLLNILNQNFGSTGRPDGALFVMLKYYVEFFEPYTLAQS